MKLMTIKRIKILLPMYNTVNLLCAPRMVLSSVSALLSILGGNTINKLFMIYLAVNVCIAPTSPC